jgi:predicted nucleotidyltransferase
MITLKEKSIIKRLASRYRVKRVLLFGSSLTKKTAHDIDLAVEGLPAKHYFEFYGDLLFSLPKPVDLLDLSKDSKFTRLVRQEGLAIYG